MKSRRQQVATLVSSIMSQVLVILLLVLSSSSSSTTDLSSSASSSHGHTSSSSYLFHLLLLTLLDTASSISISDSDSSSHSILSRKKRKRKRRRIDFDDDSQIQQQQQQQLVLSLSDDPSSFKLCFRMSSVTFEWLSGLLEPLLECRDPVGSSLNLSPHLRLAIGLFRLATGSPYPDISRRFDVSESTARFCTKQLCRVLCTNFRFWVAFPNPSDLLSVSSAFQSLSGLPNCCGIILCTRFQILHHRFPIATQIVVDSSSRILNIATGFRGDKVESLVLESSALYEDVQGGHLLSSPPPVYLDGVAIPQYLIGLGGYPLLPWLMVPSSSSSSSDEFNAVHHSMRRPALRTVASLRNWGILSRPIQEEEINMAVACIGACSILHNVLLMREDFSALSSDPMDDDHHDYYYNSSQDWRSSRESSLEESSAADKASAIRNALAARARQLRADLIQRNEQQP